MAYRITHVRIMNVMGVEELEFDAGKVTGIGGKNRSGKTSIVKAIKTALGGGHDAELIRKGADEAEVVLLLEDIDQPDNPITVRKRIKPDGSDLKVDPTPAGIGPQGYLNVLQDSFGLNPVELISDSKKRPELILDALELRVDVKALEEAITPDDTVGPLAGVPQNAKEADALSVIETVHKKIYSDRTESNKAAKKAQQRAEHLQKSLPDDDEPDVERLRETDEELADEYKRLQARQNQIIEQRTKIQDKIEGHARHENTRKLLKEEELEARSEQSMSDLRTEALDNLDNLKTDIANDLPFGIQFDDEGQVFVDGVHFDKLNTEQQIDLAMKLATMRKKELPIVLMDGLERLDEQHMAAFYKWANGETGDVQFFVTSVTNHELGISATS